MGIRPGTFQRLLRKVSAQISPPAGANTFGAPFLVMGAFATYPNIEVHMVRMTTGGVFGAETLTVQVLFRFDDGTTQIFQQTFTATGVVYDLTLGNLMSNAFADGKVLTSVSAIAESTIAASTANCTILVAAVGSE